MEDLDIIEQIVNPIVTERLGEVCQNDEEDRKRLKEEDLIFLVTEILKVQNVRKSHKKHCFT